MMGRIGIGLASALLASVTTVAQAQDSLPSAPVAPPASPAPPCAGAIIRAVDGTVHCLTFETRPMIRLAGSAQRWVAGASLDWIRWPRALNAPADWISESEPAVQQWLADPARRSRGITYLLDVGPDGGVRGCTIQRHTGFAEAPSPAHASLCDTLRRTVRLRHALDANGQPVASAFEVTVDFAMAMVQGGGPPQPLITELQVSPAPPPPPPAVPQWPPSWAQLPTAVTIPLAQGGTTAFAPHTPGWTGVLVTSGPDGVRSCQIVRPSADPRFDRRACQAASRRGALSYDWPTSGRVYPMRTPIHFVPVDGRPHAIMPVARGVVGAAIPSEVLQMLADRAAAAATGQPAPDLAALRLSAGFDRTGRATRCEVVETSGNDAADVAACTALRSAQGILPGHDIFGWPVESTTYGLSLARSAP